MSIKCNLNYQSLYAFVDNTQIHIDELIKSTDEKVKQKIKCINGHQLIFANGKKNKPYFRHKNTDRLLEIIENAKNLEELKVINLDIKSIIKDFNENKHLHEKPKKKKAIPAAIKKLVWNTHIGEEVGKTKCLCCKTTDITQMSFNCGHIIAEANGGEVIVSNLKPICQNCNSSMGTQNMNDFMKGFK